MFHSLASALIRPVGVAAKYLDFLRDRTHPLVPPRAVAAQAKRLARAVVVDADVAHRVLEFTRGNVKLNA
jgi:hypothetical protein